MHVTLPLAAMKRVCNHHVKLQLQQHPSSTPSPAAAALALTLLAHLVFSLPCGSSSKQQDSKQESQQGQAIGKIVFQEGAGVRIGMALGVLLALRQQQQQQAMIQAGMSAATATNRL
jgi:hypothetical protein